ncbi:MAG: hypothetical protein ABIO70_15645 [Pseudomonadota bacterium]
MPFRTWFVARSSILSLALLPCLACRTPCVDTGRAPDTSGGLADTSGGLAEDCTGGLGYGVVTLEVDGTTEHRLCADGRHFGTLLLVDGALAFRPHPGHDPDGWGTTWYPAPFLAGAVLGGATVDALGADGEGVHLDASGPVCAPAGASFGGWSLHAGFTFDGLDDRVEAVGSVAAHLAAPLADEGDLSLYRIASNLLLDVPLRDGTTGTTGDLSTVSYALESGTFTWDPASQPAHFPIDTSDLMDVVAEGAYNQVDTAAMGLPSIAPAHKPSLRVVLTNAGDPGLEMSFGAMYDLTLSQAFNEDNIGITPIIQRASPRTELSFQLLVQSWAPTEP